MRTKLLLLFGIISYIFFTGCQMFVVDPAQNNKIFNPTEYNIFHKTVLAMGLDHGYDNELELNYIFSVKKENYSIPLKNDYSFDTVLDNIDDQLLVQYAEKIYYMYYSYQYLKYWDLKNKNWKFYNYITDELWGSIESYYFKFDIYLKNNRSGIYQKFSKEKLKIKQKAIMHIHDKILIVGEYK